MWDVPDEWLRFDLAGGLKSRWRKDMIEFWARGRSNFDQIACANMANVIFSAFVCASVFFLTRQLAREIPPLAWYRNFPAHRTRLELVEQSGLLVANTRQRA